MERTPKESAHRVNSGAKNDLADPTGIRTCNLSITSPALLPTSYPGYHISRSVYLEIRRTLSAISFFRSQSLELLNLLLIDITSDQIRRLEKLQNREANVVDFAGADMSLLDHFSRSSTVCQSKKGHFSR